LILETLDYKEPTSQSDHPVAKTRMVKLRVLELTNPIFEDCEHLVEERCFVKWSTRLSSDGTLDQLQGIQAYKKRVISCLQQPFPSYQKIHAEAAAKAEAAAQVEVAAQVEAEAQTEAAA
jgi:hypothetical protein